METACIKLKFTSLLQPSQKNSKSNCYLEIMPEVSYLANLEKLLFGQKSNSIEYTVPITYKITLKKDLSTKPTCIDIAKVYYSCVDLLLSPNIKSNPNLETSDKVSRMVSDTLILPKNLYGLPEEERVKELPARNIDSHCSKSTDTINNIASTSKTKDLEPVNAKTCLLRLKNDHVKSDRTITNSKSKTELNERTTLDTVLQKIRSDDNLKRKLGANSLKGKLCRTPVFSVNTREIVEISTSFSLVPYRTKASDSKIYKDECKQLGSINYLKNISNGSNTALKSKHDVYYTVNPKLRIAQCVDYIKKEMWPLNAVLEELINKCSIFDFSNVQAKKIKPLSNASLSSSHKDLELFNSLRLVDCYIDTNFDLSRNSDMHDSSYSNKISEVPQNSDMICEQRVSNRAVFSIVFDK